MWTLAFGHHEDRTPTHRYETTREARMAAGVGARRARFLCLTRNNAQAPSENLWTRAIDVIRCIRFECLRTRLG